MQIGMIGLGRMGANMVQRLLTDDHNCVVYARTKSTRDEMADLGAEAADSVEDLALIVRGHAVSFTNALDFGEDLLAYAGQRVRVTGVWVGEQIQIEVLAPARPGSR